MSLPNAEGCVLGVTAAGRRGIGTTGGRMSIGRSERDEPGCCSVPGGEARCPDSQAPEVPGPEHGSTLSDVLSLRWSFSFEGCL